MTEPKRKLSPAVIVLIILVGGLGAVTVLGGGIYMLFVHEIARPVTDSDRAMVVTAEDLREMVEGLEVKPTVGVLKKVGHYDGSVEITYEYDRASDKKHPLYVNTTLSYEPKPSDARTVYHGYDLGMAIGIGISADGKVTRRDCPFKLKLGDENKCKQVLYEDNPVGIEVHVLAGQRAMFFNATGAIFDSGEPLQTLLEPRVELARRWKP